MKDLTLALTVTSTKQIKSDDTKKELQEAIEDFSLALQSLSDKYQIEIDSMITSKGVSLKKQG